jgi:LCP family protein required for cell wall assembly
MVEAGAWGPMANGGLGRRWPRRALALLSAGAVAYAAAIGSVATLAVQAVSENIELLSVGGLDLAQDGKPLHVLVVGSDERGNLTRAERDALSLGDFDGARSDTVILLTVAADRSNVSLVSMPRDLVVGDTDGGIAKLTETFGDGRDELVRAVTEDLGFPVNHYIEVSITGFMQTVEVVGSVQICLDEPLRDRKSGANFEAGCQEMDPQESLAYVRSRQGGLGDFERIERQQTFLRALLGRVIDAQLLLDPGRMLTIANEVSQQIATDDTLTVTRMVRLAQDLRGAVGGDVEMLTVPGYTKGLNDSGVTKSFIVPYGPGLAALLDDVRNGRDPATRGTAEERAETTVGVWTGGRQGAGVVESTLQWGGFLPLVLGSTQIDAGAITTVYVVPGFEAQAGYVAAHLGAPMLPLPLGVDIDQRAEVIVSVGDDAGDRSDQA